MGLLHVHVPLARHALLQQETSFTSEAVFLCPTLVSNMSAFLFTSARALSSSVFESAHSFNFVSYVLLHFDKSATCLCQCTPVLASKRFSFFALVSLSRNLLVLPLQKFPCFLECVEPRPFPIVSSLTGSIDIMLLHTGDCIMSPLLFKRSELVWLRVDDLLVDGLWELLNLAMSWTRQFCTRPVFGAGLAIRQDIPLQRVGSQGVFPEASSHGCSRR